MATRGMIARTDGTHIIGVYHHWDSYPSGLGAMLYSLYNGHFQRDCKAMLAMLIEQHPAGWSTINDKDFALTPGYSAPDYEAFSQELFDQQVQEYNASERGRRPHCYCHGDRHEQARLLYSFADATKMWTAYAYVIDEHTDRMCISVRNGNEWREIAQIDLRATEPNWDELDRKWCFDFTG